MGSCSIRVSLLAAALGVHIAAPAQAARIDYTIDAGVEHDDNVRLAPDDPDAQRILRAGLGVLVTQDGSAVQAAVAGRADYRDFQGGIDDGVEGMLSAYLNWVVLQDRLSFTVQDELELQAIDRYAADAPDNRQQVNVVSAGPNLLFGLGRLDGRLEARWVDTRADVTDEFDSTRIGAALRLGREIDDRSRLGFNAQWTDVDYDHPLLARDHERTDVYARFERQQARTDYAIDAGYSWLDYADGEKRDSPLLRLEAGWRQGERNRVSLALAHQFSDAADQALLDGAADRPEATVPGGVLVDGGAIVPSVYRLQRAALAWDHAGERVGLRTEAYAQRLRYVDALVPDEDDHGLLLALSWRLAPTVTLAGWAGFERIEYRQLGAEDEARRMGLSLEKRWTRHWSTSLSYYRYERDSGVLDNEVRQNVWYLWMSYRNRPQ